MTDMQPPPPQRRSVLGEVYPIPPPAATSSLVEILRDRIRAGGPLGFAEFMETSLYHPELGYYARAAGQTGRGGDFFTSVSVGPLFGQLMARRFLRHWLEENRPDRWRVIELGAHDGALAADILGTLRDLDSAAFGGLEYVIAEPLPALREIQAKTLAEYGARIRIVTDLQTTARDPLPGLAFGNEVLDALPFHILIRSNGRWMERAVTFDQTGHFIWEPREITDPAMIDSIQQAGDGFPDGYLTEIRTGYRGFLTPIAGALRRGLMIWADYGFARPEYLHPDRRNGTLRTFRQHRAADDPLADPGGADITAHVDFTAVAKDAIQLGGRPLAFKSQGAWLGENAREWLLAQEGITGNPLLRQFQTLTHPGHLGACFHVLELTWDPQRAPASPELLDHRLALAWPGKF